MKTIYLFCFILLVSDVFGQWEHEKPWLVISETQAASKRNFSAAAWASDYGYDVVYNRCIWQIDPSQYFISGNVYTGFRVTNPTGISVFKLDLHNNLSVDSIKFNNQKLLFTHISGKLLINLPTDLSFGTKSGINVFYKGTPVASGFGSFIRSQHQSVPIIWTLSEPYGAYEWWPCKQSLEDKIDSIDIFIVTPNVYKAASNGLLIDSAILPNNQISWHWKHRYPIATYLVALAVTNYTTFTQQISLPGMASTLPVANYVYPEYLSTALPLASQITLMMQKFSQWFGLYPFSKEKYGHAQFGWGGGMEHQTMSFMNNLDRGLMAHELAHQWFGDKITCGSWTDIWLNEGFATYAEALIRETLDGQTAFKNWRLSTINNICSQAAGSVFCADTTNVNRIFNYRLTYQKGAMALHQIRYSIGDAAFFGGLKNYISDTALSYRFARTANLKTHLESSCQCNLQFYFDQYIYGQGHPSWRVSYYQTHPDSVFVRLNQTVSAPQTTPFFNIKVPITLKSANKDTVFKLNHQFDGQNFVLKPGFMITGLEIDAGRDLISQNNVVLNTINARKPTLLAIFPNPAKTYFGIGSHNLQIQKVEIYQTNGKRLFGYGLDIIQKNHFDISGLPIGLYFVLITDNQGRKINMKIIKNLI